MIRRCRCRSYGLGLRPGRTAEPMLAATATNTTAKTIPIMRCEEYRMTGCRRGRLLGGGVSRGSSQTNHSSTYAAAV